MRAGEGNDVLALRSFRCQWNVLAFGKELGMAAAIAEGAPDQVQLDPAVFLLFDHLSRGVRQGDAVIVQSPHAIQNAASVLVVHGPAVVRIDQAEVP